MGENDGQQKKRFRTLMQPRFSDFDLQGILNSAKYLDLLSEARFEQMEHGYKKPIQDYVNESLTFVISEFHIRYLRPITYGSKVLIETEVVEMEGPKAVVEYSFLTEQGEKISASGRVVYHLFDLKTRRPKDFTDQDRAIFI